jgi:hypothetical protein
MLPASDRPLKPKSEAIVLTGHRGGGKYSKEKRTIIHEFLKKKPPNGRLLLNEDTVNK